MNLEARKLILIEEFLKISDENIIAKLESFIKQEKKSTRERKPKPMPMDEFLEMIEKAKQDIEAGRVVSHSELKKRIKTWK